MKNAAMSAAIKSRNSMFFIIALVLLLSCNGNNNVPGGSGLIEATEVTISSETAGQITRLLYEEGDKVAPGDTIVLIDTVTASLRLRQAEAAHTAAETRLRHADIAVEQAELNLSLAEKEYDRAKALIKTGSMNQQQYDQMENAHSQAALARRQAKASREAAAADLNRLEADLELLEKQFSDCFPITPVGGIVTEKFIEAGELATLGKALVKIARLDTVWVKIYLNPEDLTKIKLGSPAEIDPEDGRETPLAGEVTWISDAAEFTPKNVQTREARANMVYAVKIIIPNPEQTLKIGMPVAVRIP